MKRGWEHTVLKTQHNEKPQQCWRCSSVLGSILSTRGRKKEQRQLLPYGTGHQGSHRPTDAVTSTLGNWAALPSSFNTPSLGTETPNEKTNDFFGSHLTVS